MQTLIQEGQTFDTLKLDQQIGPIPALLAIRSNQSRLKNVFIQMPFPLSLSRVDSGRLLEAIGEELSNMESLSIECYDINQQSMENFVNALRRNKPPLSEFCLWDVNFDDDEEEATATATASLDSLVMTLSSFSTLEKIALGVASRRSAQEHQHHLLNESSLLVLCHNPRLVSLRLGNVGLDLKQIHLIADAVGMLNSDIDDDDDIDNNDNCKGGGSSFLRTLELHGENLDLEGWLAIALMLRRNRSLRQFSLFEFKGLDDRGAIALAEALRHNTTLRVLSVETAADDDEDDNNNHHQGNNSTVTTSGNVAMAQMLQHDNQTLLSLCFSSGGLTDEACAAYANALESNETLRELELGTYDTGRGGRSQQQQIGSRGVIAIANSLAKNNRLEKLSLCCQQGLDDAGAIAVAEGLRHNKTLKHLLLEDDDDAVTQKGYEAMVQMLQKNTTLQSIYQESAGELRSKMQYYLTLNQRGIRNLLLNVNATREQFLNAIVSNQEDLDSLYYILLLNPSFCDLGFFVSNHQQKRNRWEASTTQNEFQHFWDSHVKAT